MDYAVIAKDAGCLATAVEDVVRRCEARFAGEQPSQEAVREWLTSTLRPAASHLFTSVPTQPWDKLGIPREVWNSLGPSTKLAMARAQQPSPTTIRPHPLRPTSRTLTEAEVGSLKDLTLTERLTQGRAMQQAPVPQG
jgi:hypothetical protein